MLDKLAEVEKRYVELEALMLDPQLLHQQREYSKFAKERSELEEIVARYREWRKVEQEIQENRQLLEENDEAIRELAKEELVLLRTRKDELENKLKVLILPKDPTMPRTLSSRSAPAPAATRRPCSRRNYFACTRATPSRAAGASR